MGRNLSAKQKLLRAFLSKYLVKRLQAWLEGSKQEGVCWVCLGRGCFREDGSTYDAHWGPMAPQPGEREYITLALLKGNVPMGWKNAKKHAESRPEFVSLKADGEMAEFIPITEPEPTTKPGMEKGTTREVYRVHVLSTPAKVAKPNTLDLTLRAFEKYAEQVGEGHEFKSVIRMVRHGAKDDQSTFYTFTVKGKASPAAVKLAREAMKGIVSI